MTCIRCENELPENTKICPVCGELLDPQELAQIRTAKFIVWLSDFLSLIMSGINIFILATSSHYVNFLQGGLWNAKKLAYHVQPGMKLVDALSAMLLLGVLIIFTIARYHMYRERKIGMKLMIISYGCHLLWTALYLVFCFAVTGVLSFVLPFSIIQMAVFFVFAVALSVFFIKSKRYRY